MARFEKDKHTKDQDHGTVLVLARRFRRKAGAWR